MLNQPFMTRARLPVDEVTVPKMQQVAADAVRAGSHIVKPARRPATIKTLLPGIHVMALFGSVESTVRRAGNGGVAAADDASFKKAMTLQQLAAVDPGQTTRGFSATVAGLCAQVLPQVDALCDCVSNSVLDCSSGVRLAMTQSGIARQKMRF